MVPGCKQSVYSLVYADTGERAPRNAYSQEYLDYVDQPGNPSPLGLFARYAVITPPGNHIPLADEPTGHPGPDSGDPSPPGLPIPVVDDDSDSDSGSIDFTQAADYFYRPTDGECSVTDSTLFSADRSLRISNDLLPPSLHTITAVNFASPIANWHLRQYELAVIARS